MKFCVDCKHINTELGGGLGNARCAHEKTRMDSVLYPVAGDLPEAWPRCVNERNMSSAATCGTEAKFFEPKSGPG